MTTYLVTATRRSYPHDDLMRRIYHDRTIAIMAGMCMIEAHCSPTQDPALCKLEFLESGFATFGDYRIQIQETEE